jgi:hypothetical protein
MLKDYIKPKLNLAALVIKGDNRTALTTIVDEALREAGNPDSVLDAYHKELEEGVTYNHAVYVSWKYINGRV